MESTHFGKVWTKNLPRSKMAGDLLNDGLIPMRMQYLPLLWPVRQSGAAVEHNYVRVTLGLLSKQHVANTPISHFSLVDSILKP